MNMEPNVYFVNLMAGPNLFVHGCMTWWNAEYSLLAVKIIMWYALGPRSCNYNRSKRAISNVKMKI